MCESCTAFVQAMHGAEDRDAKLRSQTELELARIERDKEITLAKIAQKMNQDDNEAALVEAETAAEVQADVIDSLTPEPEVIETDPVAVIVDTGDDGSEAIDESELDVPEAEEHHEDSAPKHSGYGASWFYG